MEDTKSHPPPNHQALGSDWLSDPNSLLKTDPGTALSCASRSSKYLCEAEYTGNWRGQLARGDCADGSRAITP